MRFRLVPLGVLLALVLIGPMAVHAQDATPAAATTPPVSSATGDFMRTDVRYLLPFGPDGLNGTLTVTANAEGVCGFASSAALGRSDAWDCIGTDDQIYDPCFENPFTAPDKPTELACFASPFTEDVVLLTTTQPLDRQKDAGPTRDAAMALPWAVELANGERCTVIVGNLQVLAGMPVDYACDGGGSIVGTVDRAEPIWAASYLANDAIATTLVEVVTVWQ